jgi:hypothetical protein
LGKEPAHSHNDAFIAHANTKKASDSKFRLTVPIVRQQRRTGKGEWNVP